MNYLKLKKLAIDYYREGRNYETLICRAFNCKRGKRFGANQEVFIALFEIDKMKQSYGSYTVYDRQFLKVKLNLEKALLKLKKKKKYHNSYYHFTPMLLRLHKATKPQHLIKIINITLSIIIRLENQRKRQQRVNPPMIKPK